MRQAGRGGRPVHQQRDTGWIIPPAYQQQRGRAWCRGRGGGTVWSPIQQGGREGGTLRLFTLSPTHQRLCLLHELALGPEEPLDRLHAECLQHLHASKRVRESEKGKGTEREREREREAHQNRYMAHRRELQDPVRTQCLEHLKRQGRCTVTSPCWWGGRPCWGVLGCPPSWQHHLPSFRSTSVQLHHLPSFRSTSVQPFKVSPSRGLRRSSPGAASSHEGYPCPPAPYSP